MKKYPEHDGKPRLMLWRAAYGSVSKKPIEVIDLGDGMIKVLTSAMIRWCPNDSEALGFDPQKGGSQ